ncbi:general substrate transporter [Kockovaella imperatae]|uniref:General substrate transporter n=1 Tax=Kockovaella imperatae TaxID=4999 RepID=A0A1Y1UG24_9TREE|nr:general substrate transporter [Kockovaella imperatae]ORX37003.1 general substrate transporter [Kockovaella imperatae]
MFFRPVAMAPQQATAETQLDQELVQIGHEVIARQKQETFSMAWRNHWRGAVWSLLISMALWMEGFDTSLLGNFMGHPAFRARFGTVIDGVKKIPNHTQVGLSETTICGQLVGLVITGIAQERYGAKRTFFWGMTALTGTIFLAVFAQNLAMLFVAGFLNGVPWGMFQTLTTAYAAEICPINLRGYLAAWAQIAWSGGGVIATGVLRGTLTMEGDWAWRLPYALQWLWPVPLALLVLIAPESPWWLVRKGRYDDAKAVVRRNADRSLYGPGEVDGYVEYMKHTDALDRAEQARGSFLDMFRGTNRRRTEVQIGTWVTQIFCGSAITALSVLFFEKAGMSTTLAFNFSLILTGISIFGVFLSWVLIRYFGRRTLYLSGLVIIAVCNLIIATLGFTTEGTASLNAIGALMVIIQFTFCATLGPVCYIIVGEIPASRLRAQSIVLGRFSYVVIVIIVGTFNPYVTNDWGPKSGYFWMGTGLSCLVWCYFRLPETKGRSFADIDILFANKIPARQFATTSVDEQREAMDKIQGGDEDVKLDAVHAETK